ncbi:hypothetical protein [Ornithinimicrobium kibberense]|uniref:hypothetical protein n=1 Tax=Ornithinimicrobium kibberense TaxID=282060 RepID=UPI00360B08B4
MQRRVLGEVLVEEDDAGALADRLGEVDQGLPGRPLGHGQAEAQPCVGDRRQVLRRGRRGVLGGAHARGGGCRRRRGGAVGRRVTSAARAAGGEQARRDQGRGERWAGTCGHRCDLRGAGGARWQSIAGRTGRGTSNAP